MMTRTILTTAAALFAGATALPALAQDVDLTTMTCADFRALSEEQQMDVALMALAEQNSSGGESLLDTAKAGNPETEETEEAGADDGPEGTLVDNDGTATATDGGEDVDNESVTEANLESLMAACDRNLNAMVLEAAAGMDTSR